MGLTQLFKKQLKLLTLVVFSSLLSSCSEVWNNPHPAGAAEREVLFSSFSSPPKHLDPVISYNANEWAFLSQVVEPLFQYHYLKRPYQLDLLTLSTFPEKVFLAADKLTVVDTENAKFTRYTFQIKDDIYYQPHPAFEQDLAGNFIFHDLDGLDKKAGIELDDIKIIADFPTKSAKRLTVDDYIYAIKRMAVIQNHSPILGTMNQLIVGLEDYSKKVSKDFDLKEDYKLSKYDISGVSKLSDTEFSILVKGKYPQFLYWLSMNFFAPVPWEAVKFYDQKWLAEKNISLSTYPVGTGAYMLAENNPNRQIRLVANPNYKHGFYPTVKEGLADDVPASLLEDAGKPLPFIEEAIYSLEKESVPLWNKFLQGFYDASGVSSSSFDQAISISGSGQMNLTDEMIEKNINFLSVVEPTIFYFAFNMADSVVGGYSEQQQKLRQAISIAINYEEYISVFLNGRGTIAHGPIPPGLFGHEEGAINPFVYDLINNQPIRKPIEYAKQLLAEAGFPNGRDANGEQLSLHFDTAATGPDSKSLLNWYRKQFDKLGIQLVIRATDYNRFQDKVRTASVQMFTWGWNADYPDPENFLFLLDGKNAPINTEGAGVNGANYDNPEFNKLFAKMKRMKNSPQRQEVINKMLEMVQKDAPWAFGFYPKSIALTHSWYQNVWPNPLANNTLKYKKIDAALRVEKQQLWNQPVVWPLWLLLALIILSIYPILKAYRKSQLKVISPPTTSQTKEGR